MEPRMNSLELSTNTRHRVHLGAQLPGQERIDRDAVRPAAAAPRLGQLEATLFATQEELARRTEELEAARQINRELISRVNRHGR